MKGAVMGIGYLIKAFGWVAETIFKVYSGPLRILLKGLALLGFGPAKDALKAINSGIEGVGTFFDKAGNAVQDYADKLDGLKNKKFKLLKPLKMIIHFKIPLINKTIFKSSFNINKT
jgi:hypothetical protein